MNSFGGGKENKKIKKEALGVNRSELRAYFSRPYETNKPPFRITLHFTFPTATPPRCIYITHAVYVCVCVQAYVLYLYTYRATDNTEAPNNSRKEKKTKKRGRTKEKDDGLIDMWKSTRISCPLYGYIFQPIHQLLKAELGIIAKAKNGTASILQTRNLIKYSSSFLDFQFVLKKEKKKKNERRFNCLVHINYKLPTATVDGDACRVKAHHK